MISSENHDLQFASQLYELAYTIGLFLGDGNLHFYQQRKGDKWYPMQCVRFGCLKSDGAALQRVQDEIEATFGRRYAIMPRQLNSGTDFLLLHIYRKDIFDFFAFNTALKGKIPEPFFSAPDDIKREIIAGLMDSDGHISHRVYPTYQQWSVGFANTKRELVEGAAILMRQLGIKVGKIGESRKGEYTACYRVAPNIKGFVQAGCFFRSERKAAKLADCLKYMIGSETLHAAPASTGEDKVHSSSES